MAVTEAAFNGVMEECRSAIRTGDTQTARLRIAEAEVINAGLPLDVSLSGGDGVHVRRRESLTAAQRLIDAVDQSRSLNTRGSRFVRTRTNFR